MALRIYSPHTIAACGLLGAEIALARRERRLSAAELAERLGVNRDTLAKVERGDPSVGLGIAFEAAALVGVPLFDEDPASLGGGLTEARQRLALLPARVRSPRASADVDDDF
jgi:transcriptional regulator with XRE-family HTH domain